MERQSRQIRVFLFASWCATMTLAAGALINGPDPMTAVQPVGAIVTFTCVVNTSELLAGTTLVGINTDGLISWIMDGSVLQASNQSVTENGVLQTGTRKLLVLPDYTTSVPIQCEVISRMPNNMFMASRTNNATLTAYGK